MICSSRVNRITREETLSVLIRFLRNSSLAKRQRESQPKLSDTLTAYRNGHSTETTVVNLVFLFFNSFKTTISLQ